MCGLKAEAGQLGGEGAESERKKRGNEAEWEDNDDMFERKCHYETYCSGQQMA